MKQFKVRVLFILALCAVMLFGVVAAGCTNEEETPSGTTYSVTLDRETLEVDRYGTATLQATVEPAGTELVWSSSNEAVCTVSGGTVTPTGVGTATVTVQVKGQEAKDECAVTVTEGSDRPILTVTPSPAEVLKGQELKVTPSLTYRGAAVEGATYTYKTDSSEVATVSADGVLTGVKAGSCELAVEATWKGATFPCTVTVNVKADIGITLKANGEAVPAAVTLRKSLPEGCDESYIRELTVSATVVDAGEEIANPTVVWKAEDDTVVSVANGTVTALAVGKTTVSATYTAEGGDSSTAQFEVEVVLPDLEKDVTLEADRTRDPLTLDLYGIASGILSAKVGEYDLGTVAGSTLTVSRDWINASEDKAYDAVFATEEVIYKCKVNLYSRYVQADLNDIAGNFDHTLLVPNAALWVDPTAEEQALLGGRTSVKKYDRTAENVTIGNPFADRIEIRADKAFKGKTAGYITFELYLLEGTTQFNIWTDPGAKYHEFRVGTDFNQNDPFKFIGENGALLTRPATEQWMTVVVNFAAGGNSRVSIMSNRDELASFFVANVRGYEAKDFDLPSLKVALPETIKLVPEQVYTFDAESLKLAVPYSETMTDLAPESVKIASAESVVTVDEAARTITAGTEEGTTTVTVTLTYHGYTIAVEIEVTVSPVEEITAESTFAVDRLAKAHVLDFATIPELEGREFTAENVTIEGAETANAGTMSEGKLTLTEEWMAATKDGTYTVVVTFIDTIYRIPLRLFTRYLQADLNDYANNWDKPFIVTADIWVDPTEDDEAILGGRTGVKKYVLTQEVGAGNAFSYRVEPQPEKAFPGKKVNYITFELYIPKGSTQLSFLAKSPGDVWYSFTVGTELPANYPFKLIGADGSLLKAPVAEQWMTVVVGYTAGNMGRIALLSQSGAVTSYFVANMRGYEAQDLNVPYVKDFDTEINLRMGKEYTFNAPELAVAYTDAAVTAESFTIACDDEKITLDAEAHKITAKNEAGEVTVNVTVTCNGYTYVIPVTVTIAKKETVEIKEGLQADKLAEMHVLDFTAIPELKEQQFGLENLTIEGLSTEKMGTMSEGKLTLDADWLKAAQDGNYTLTITLEDTIYRIPLRIFTKYVQANLSDASTDDQHSFQTPNPAIWVKPTEEEEALFGGREGVMKFDLTTKNNGFGDRVEMRKAFTGKKVDYITFDLYLLKDYTQLNIWTSAGYNELRVGSNVGVNAPFKLYDENGAPLTQLVAEKWITIVVDYGAKNLTRLAFMSNGTELTAFLVANMRAYEAQDLDIGTSAAAQEATAPAPVALPLFEDRKRTF